MLPSRNRFARSVIAAIIIGSAGCTAQAPSSRLDSLSNGGKPPFFGAIALGLFTHPPDPAVADRDFASMVALGANGVVYPVLWSSSDVGSTRIEPFDYGVPLEAYDRSTIEIARRAHARGLAFELRPIIRLEHLAPGEWRGTLRPSDWNAWWVAYTAFVLHHAALAQSAGAEIFCIGSELRTTESDREHWARLISEVRGLFGGIVIYSANWDHYREVPFWDLLDGIGLSAYYELSDRPGATQDELDAAWRAHRDRIVSWAGPIGKPLYLTEVGYPAQAAGAVHPWDYTISDRADPAAQERCFRAFAAAWEGVALLRGTTIWIWNHGQSGPGDPSYSIEGKPAAAVVRSFFEHRRRSP